MENGELTFKGVGCTILGILLVVVLGFVGCNVVQRVDPGNVGLVVDYSKGTISGQPSITTVPTGSYNFLNPFTQSLQEYPVAQQTLTMVRVGGEGQVTSDDSVGCQDMNGIPINVDSSALWRVDPTKADKLYLLRPGMPLIGASNGDISSVVVRREVRNAVTVACSQYSYDEIYGAKRVEFGLTVANYLGPELASSYILLDKFIFGEIYLSPVQQEAISRKAVAQQAAIEASYLAEKARNEAAAAVAQAEGAKQVEILKAQAQAEAINIIQQQLNASPAYIEYLYAKNWNGALPSTLVLSDGQSFPLLLNGINNKSLPPGTGPSVPPEAR